MKIGIICALQEELDGIISNLGLNLGLNAKVQEDGRFTIYQGAYLHHELIFIL
jgi:hypothetical protein